MANAEQTFRAKAPGIMAQLVRDFSITPEDAAAIVGNLGHESLGFTAMQEFKPVVEGSRGGWGWAQWTGPRPRAFEAYCARTRADIINDPEFKAECRAALERALIGAAQRQETDAKRVAQWIGKEYVPQSNFNAFERRPPKPQQSVELPILEVKPKRRRINGERRALGMSKTLSEWAEYLGMTVNNLNQYIHRHGSFEAAVSARLQFQRPRAGVGKNFAASEGTGGGRHAQDISELEFSE